MEPSAPTLALETRPDWTAVLELLKPITWFAPMWAFGCGVVSSGVPSGDRWPAILAGIVLAGPMVCATSQAVNDWYDRHVDAINEPNRPIPSGRMPGPLGPLHRHRLDRAVAAGGDPAGPLGLRRRRRRPGARLGLQRAAVPAQAQRLVGQQRRGGLLRGPALVHRRRRDGGAAGRAGPSSSWRRSTASARTAS